MKAGGFLRRSLAFQLDEAIVGLVWFLGTLWLSIVYGLTADQPAAIDTLALLLGASLCLGAVLNAIYFVGFVGACGQTPAQMLVGVRVVRRNGSRVGYGRALLRFIGSGLVFATLGIGWLVAALDAERRGIQDWVSGTRVVREGA